jgi:hypothetical protein
MGGLTVFSRDKVSAPRVFFILSQVLHLAIPTAVFCNWLGGRTDLFNLDGFIALTQWKFYFALGPMNNVSQRWL